jgi:hypothetical protein
MQDYNFEGIFDGTVDNNNTLDSDRKLNTTIAKRLAEAINASMRQTDISIAGYESFVPWMYANAGALYAIGQCVIRFTNLATTPEIQLGAAFSDYMRIFVNNIVRSNDEQVSASTKLFPSRLCRSYPNFPEIFDAPYIDDPRFSDSAVDVNPADGQELTAFRSLFGISAFAGSQAEGMIAAWKQDAVYLVNMTTKEYHRIVQPYGGCTISDSVKETADGIMFANDNGVFLLNRQLNVVPVGKNLGRWWKSVDKDNAAIGVGHNDTANNLYKLSIPYGSSQNTNNYAVVYNPEVEKQGGYGSWCIYDAHPASAWASMGQDTFFATYDGQVFKLRNLNEDSDYRDDDQPITMTIILPMEDFGLTGVTKAVSGILCEFFNEGVAYEGITVSQAVEGSTTFNNMDPANTIAGQNITELWFTPYSRKAGKTQIRVTCSTLDNPVVLAGVAHRVAVIDIHGRKEAGET